LTSVNPIEAGYFLPGGQLLGEGIRGINETYLGWIEVNGDRLRAYVKFLTPWEIFNEALGSLLCQQVGLPTPKPYLVLVSRSDYPLSHIFQTIATDQILAYASTALSANSLARHVHLKEAPAIRELLSAWTEWPDVLMFDQWIANPDRHTGNLLVGAPGVLLLIDHGLCFNRRDWNPTQLMAAVATVTVRLWNDFLQQHIDIAKRLEAKPRIFNASQRQKAVDIKQSVVLTRIDAFLPPANLAPLIQFLGIRRDSAAQVICSATGVPDLPLGDPK
jgi:hypothetical protein